MATSAPKERLRMIVGLTVLVAWTLLVFLDAFRRDYDVPFQVHAAMLLIVGYLFAPSIVRAGRKPGNGNGSGSSSE